MEYQLLVHSESTPEFNWSHALFVDLWRFRGHLHVKLIELTFLPQYRLVQPISTVRGAKP